MGGERQKTSAGKSPAEDDRDKGRGGEKDVDPVEETIEDTFPASDPPSWSTPAPPKDPPKPSDSKK